MMLDPMLGFPVNEGESKNLKKAQELVQHFSKQYRHYVPKQNLNIDGSLINYVEEESKEEKLWFVKFWNKRLQISYVVN